MAWRVPNETEAVFVPVILLKEVWDPEIYLSSQLSYKPLRDSLGLAAPTSFWEWKIPQRESRDRMGNPIHTLSQFLLDLPHAYL